MTNLLDKSRLTVCRNIVYKSHLFKAGRDSELQGRDFAHGMQEWLLQGDPFRLFVDWLSFGSRAIDFAITSGSDGNFHNEGEKTMLLLTYA